MLAHGGPATLSHGGPADRQPVDAERRLANTDRHALAVLAASADTGIHFQVVADHGDLGQHIRT